MTKTFTLARTVALALIAAGYVSLTPAAHAADPEQAPQAEMNVAGTDFSSPKAVEHLINRLHRVALDICNPDGARPTAMSEDQRKCVDAAVKTGLAQIESKRQQAMRDTGRDTGVHVAEAPHEATKTN